MKFKDIRGKVKPVLKRLAGGKLFQGDPVEQYHFQIRHALAKKLDGDLYEAFQASERALQIAKDRGRDGTGDVVVMVNELRELYQQGGDIRGIVQFDEIFEHYESAVSHISQLGDKMSASHLLWGLGTLHRSSRRLDEALRCFEEALRIGSRDPRTQAQQWGEVGKLHIALYQHDRAIAAFKKALRLVRGNGEKIAVEWLLGLGNAYALTADLRRACAAYQQGLEVSQTHQLGHHQPLFVGGLGVVAELSGQYEQAVEFYQQAASLSLEADHDWYHGYWSVRLVEPYLRLGYFKRAREALQIGLDTVKKYRKRHPPGTSDARYATNLEALCRLQGGLLLLLAERVPEAVKEINIALRITRHQEYRIDESLCLAYLGFAEAQTGQVESGLTSCQEGLRLAKDRQARVIEAEVHHLLGKIYAMHGAPDSAREHFAQAADIFSRCGNSYFLGQIEDDLRGLDS